MEQVNFNEFPILGFGAMRMPMNEDKTVKLDDVIAMVDYCFANGINYFDTAYMYHNGTSERILKDALTSRHDRNTYYLADKMPMWNVKEDGDLQKIFNEQLEKCGVDYFDMYMLHCMMDDTYAMAQKWDAFGFGVQMKAEGKIKHFGFSFHGTSKLLDEILTAHPEVEFVQLQINYLDWDGIQAGEFYNIVRKHGKAVIVMEPVKGGTLARVPAAVEKLFKDANPEASVASWAMRYCFGLEGVIITLSGMSNMEQLVDNINTAKNFKPLNEEEQAIVAKAVEEIIKAKTVPCTGCEYCINCPVKINIPARFALYNRFVNRELTVLEAKQLYKELNADIAECAECKACQEHCPQSIEIIEVLKQVKREIG